MAEGVSGARAPGPAARALAAAAAAAALAAAQPALAAGPVLFAAASTIEVVRDLEGVYAAAAGRAFRPVFGSSGSLARQIESGAPAAVFISANVKWVSYLVERGLASPRSRTTLFRNRMVVVAPGDSAALTGPRGAGLVSRLGESGRLAIADPRHAPAGQYARQALRALGVWDRVSGRLALTQDVRAALALVERGEAELAAVYRTDARLSRSARILLTLDEGSHSPIVYQAVTVSGAGGPGDGLMEFLASAPAGDIYRRHGFIVD